MDERTLALLERFVVAHERIAQTLEGEGSGLAAPALAPVQAPGLPALALPVLGDARIVQITGTRYEDALTFRALLLNTRNLVAMTVDLPDEASLQIAAQGPDYGQRSRETGYPVYVVTRADAVVPSADCVVRVTRYDEGYFLWFLLPSGALVPTACGLARAS